MPRRPRSHTVVQDFYVLKTWRGHNKEWNIHNPADRLRYLELLREEMAKQSNLLLASVLMANHVHEIFLIQDPTAFSSLLRKHHARYGIYFNRKYRRCGKVAQDRPHTSLIENDAHAMITTFYVLANPLRAQLCKDPRNYYFSSYNFYAFGLRPKEIPLLTYPDWYLALGSTPADRQRAFRRLFFAYLRTFGLISLGYSRRPFIGDPLWVERQKAESARKMRLARGTAPPPAG